MEVVNPFPPESILRNYMPVYENGKSTSKLATFLQTARSQATVPVGSNLQQFEFFQHCKDLYGKGFQRARVSIFHTNPSSFCNVEIGQEVAAQK